jgi:hypothetical protein
VAPGNAVFGGGSEIIKLGKELATMMSTRYYV